MTRDILTNKQQAYASRELTKTWPHGWERVVSSILVGPMDIYIPNESAQRDRDHESVDKHWDALFIEISLPV